MIYISVNIGSYSIKFLNFKVEKKKINYLSSQEVVIDQDQIDVTEENFLADLQFNLISQYLEELDQEYRLIINAPSELLTDRFLELPVGNKKKAALMVPFQLEEDIPFSLSDSHIASSIRSEKNKSSAFVNITKEDEFNSFYNKIQKYDLCPKVLTSEVSVIENYIHNTKELLPKAFCILDMGHSTTNAYFFLDKKLKSVHTSYIAGYVINEAICDTYSISADEATLYKHQNCFFLTKDSYSNANEQQLTFANLMDKTFNPFIKEFKRWHIGFRIQNAYPVTDIYTIGGTANIKNINSYLADNLMIQVSHLDTFSETNCSGIDTDPKQRRKFTICNLIAQSYISKSQIINLLHGRFSIKGTADLPLQSFTFIGLRVFIIVAILMVSTIFEAQMIKQDIKAADKKLKGILKNPVLKLAPKDIRKFKKKPNVILAKLNKEKKYIKKEIKVLQDSININAFKSFETIKALVYGIDTELIQYNSISGGDYTAVFKTKDILALEKLDEVFKASNIKNLFTEKDSAKQTFTITATED